MLFINTTRNTQGTEVNTTSIPLSFIYSTDNLTKTNTTINISADLFSEKYLLNDPKVKSDIVFKNNVLRNAILTGISCAYLLSSSKVSTPGQEEEEEAESENIVLGDIVIPVIFGKYYENIFKVSNAVLTNTPIEYVSGITGAYKFHILKGKLFGRCVTMKPSNLKIDFNNGTAIRVRLKPEIRKDS